VAKCRELGGEVLREPFASPTGAGLAWIADPEGNRVVLVQQ
jgi:predicted enzyme related to lactoylglutathione lyase